MQRFQITKQTTPRRTQNGKPAAREQSGEIIKKQGKPKNENGSEGDEEAIAEGRDARQSG